MKKGIICNRGLSGCKLEYENEKGGITTIFFSNLKKAKDFCERENMICELITPDYLYKWFNSKERKEG